MSDELAAPDGPTPARRWHAPSPSTVCGLVAGLWTFGLAVAANHELLRRRIVEDGDFAANSILIDRAMHGQLLVGNYSRVGFHHPGPAILDVQAAGQLLFFRLLHVVPAPFNGQFLGILALNALCVGICAAIVRRRLGSTAAALALPIVVVVIDRWEPWGLSSTWMPHTYICPFLLLCVAAASVATGSRHDLRYAALAGGLLVHGHVSFVMFVGATSLLALGGGWWTRRRGWGPAEAGRPRRHWAWAGGVVGLFLLPIVANLVLHWPGELEKYADFAGDRSGFAPRSVGDAVRFLAHYWTQGGVVGGLALGVGAVLAAVTAAVALRRWRPFLAGLAVVLALEAVLVVVYAYRGVDDLTQPYIGLFAYTGPVLVLWAGLAAAVGWAERLPSVGLRRAVAVVVLVAVGATVVSTATIANPYRGLRAGTGLVDAAGPGPVRLEFATPGWPSALGLLQQLRRRGRPVCVVNPAWELLVTRDEICRARDRGRLIFVYGPGEVPRGGEVVYDDGANVLVRG